MSSLWYSSAILLLLVWLESSLAQITTTSCLAKTVTVIHTSTVTRTFIATSVAPTMVANLQKTYNIVANLGPKGCIPSSGAPTNTSVAGWNVLLDDGDLVKDACTDLQFSMVPGALSNATVSLVCRGEASWLKLHGFFSYAKCTNDILRGFVFPNGKNCTARHVLSQPLYELGIVPNPCQGNPRGTGAPVKLEFSGIINVFESAVVTTFGNSVESVTVGDDIEEIRYGVQVMLLDASDRLIRTNSQVSLTVVPETGSSSLAWGRTPSIKVDVVNAVEGVASFGTIGLRQAGLYRFKACMVATPTVCGTSAIIHFSPREPTKFEILKQPESGTSFYLFDPNSRLASFTKASGPVNVTLTDEYGNRGVLGDLVIPGAFVEMGIFCKRSSGGSSQLVDTRFYNATATNLNYIEVWDFGFLKDKIDRNFGSGASGSEQGWSCNAEFALKAIASNGTVYPSATVAKISTNNFLFRT